MKGRIQFLKSFLFIGMWLVIQEGFGQQSTKIQELSQSLDQAIASKDNGKASFYSYEIAKLYSTEKQAEKATTYLTQCITYSKKAGDSMLMYLAYQQMGLLSTEAQRYTDALDNFQKALKLARELQKTEFVREGLMRVAVSYAQSGRPKKSIEPLEEALSLALQQHDVASQQKCYELLAEYYNKMGNVAKSKEYQSLYDNIIQSKQKEEYTAKQLKELEQQVNHASVEKKTVHSQLTQQNQKLRRVEDSLLAVKYSLQTTAHSLEKTTHSLQATEHSLAEANVINEKRKMEIDLLNKDKELASLRIKEQNTSLEHAALIRNSIIAGILLASALVGVMISGYRRTLEDNRRKLEDTKKIDEQNKNIKSSINYAKRIQEAMLPKLDQQKRLIPDSFVLFKPRDSVSGDFYWFTEIKNWYNPDVVIAAADCTGHGVPGAFMSMIGINALNGIISQGIAESHQILEALDSEIRKALQQETTGNNDGMDIALCVYRKEKNLLEFSGAKNPLVYIQNNELFQVKGDARSIGGSNNTKKDIAFKKHNITIEQPTTVYLFSDGYRDQFGGKDNTKFMSKKFNKLLLDIHQLPMQEQMAILDKTIEEWKGAFHQTDDILVMGLRLEASVEVEEDDD
jgi:serine phosphatase RsbU (regulator of sigma subunit)